MPGSRAASGATPWRGSSADSLAALSDTELARVDPLEMNLRVAQGIPALAGLDVVAYQRTADHWADDIQRELPAAEPQFHAAPDDWKNDLGFFRLGLVCWYVDEVLGIRYREDQKDLDAVVYTDPSDLFLSGVMDTRRGTCGNMAALHVALGWRLGMPVSLACAGWHVLCRYEDGAAVHNIEATNNGKGGFHSHPDDYYQSKYGIPDEAVGAGSDLHASSPRELLGLFLSFRARHFHDVGRPAEAARDYLQAHTLFPNNRFLRRRAKALCRLASGPERFGNPS
jgi:hypothetical protein